MKPWAAKFYGSPAWQNIRDTAIRRDNYLCVDCWKQGKLTPAAEAHHIIELTQDNINDPTISLNLDNLVSLCRDCHSARHQTRHGKRRRRYKVDKYGRVTISTSPPGGY